MSILRYRGLMVLVLWQTLPVPLTRDSTGRLQLSLGLGAGQFEEVRTDCDGNVVSTQPRPFRGAGARVDAWPVRELRLTGFAGDVASDGGSSRWSGAYYGVQGALELQHFALGFGDVAVPSGEAWPTIHLRVGNRDDLHFRFDASPPDPPFGTAGSVRAGMGYRLGHTRRLGGQGGIAFCHAACSDETNQSAGGYAELRVPLGGAVDLEVRGLAGPGHNDPDLGLAVGARVHLAVPSRPATVAATPASAH